MEETINLEEIFETLRKHLVTIIISMFAGLAISGIVTFFILTPKYSSQAQLIVTLPQSDTANVNDVNTNLQMINTYKDMIVSDLVLNEVKDRLETEDNVKMTAGQIKDAISVNQSQNSQMFSIQAISTNAVTAQQIANTTSQVFQENAKDVMNVDKISIISGAVANTTPVSPNNKLNLVIGLVLGMMVGVGLAFLFELLDRTVKDEKYVTDALGFPILGTVPEMSAKELNAGIRKKGTAPARPKATKPHHAEAAQESRRKKNGTNTETKSSTNSCSQFDHINKPIFTNRRTISYDPDEYPVCLRSWSANQNDCRDFIRSWRRKIHHCSKHCSRFC